MKDPPLGAMSPVLRKWTLQIETGFLANLCESVAIEVSPIQSQHTACYCVCNSNPLFWTPAGHDHACREQQHRYSPGFGHRDDHSAAGEGIGLSVEPGVGGLV